MAILLTEEGKRLEETKNKVKNWRRWGPYLSERQWGTVREDYSETGEAWDYFTYFDAVSRAYRWGEDGIAGISDTNQELCFSVSMWNGKDPVIKERLFGVSNAQGNHGEDVKEYYYYLDNTPTHSYMKYLYKYPQEEFPYDKLVNENKKRRREELEYELIDTGILEEDKYFDVFVEYAKASEKDLLIKITVKNRADKKANLKLLPSLWFRNNWTWFKDKPKPKINSSSYSNYLEAFYTSREKAYLYYDRNSQVLFCDNETNYHKLFGLENTCQKPKDGINNYIVHNDKNSVYPQKSGTKASIEIDLEFEPFEEKVVKLRLSNEMLGDDPFNKDFESTFENRKQEADEFYKSINPNEMPEDLSNIQRQAFAGMLWSRQFYYFNIEEWLNGDPTQPEPSKGRKCIRNYHWKHLSNKEIISMPDKWEYPWYASWDLAFHLIPFAMIDPEFAKEQLILFGKEWYMHPSGQIPAYEWNFSDVNPPVQAWAALRVYRIERKMYGRADKKFLERVFQKLLLNFTWWVNRKDVQGNNVFEGGFLGLDNIGVFDRSNGLPSGGSLEQADSTSWMAMYSLNMLAIALELALDNIVYEDIAIKFFEHFLYIANAMNYFGEDNVSLWDEEDGFYYDILKCPSGSKSYLKVRSIVGLIPLFAVETIDHEIMQALPNFSARVKWIMNNKYELNQNVACMFTLGEQERRIMAVTNEERLKRILQKMLAEDEFLSDYGIRSLSKCHKDNPYSVSVNGFSNTITYEPAESSSPMFGGNSNWRGPIWFPLNYLMIESLQKFNYYYADRLKVEFPSNSGNYLNLWEVAGELEKRLIKIFERNKEGKRPFYGTVEKFQEDENFNNYILFNEYFHGDIGAGVGASHQTGWSGLIAKIIQQYSEYYLCGKAPSMQ